MSIFVKNIYSIRCIINVIFIMIDSFEYLIKPFLPKGDGEQYKF